MAKALLMSGGTGGVTSDDVTAKRWHVVQGYTALTSDSGDEPTNGELANKGNGGAPNGVICPDMFYYTPEGAYVARFDAGAYYNTGERGQWKPYVSIPVWMAKQATNYHPEKTLSDTVTCQERGTVKMIDTKLNNYTNNKAKNIGIDYGRGKLWMELGHGNAYYYRDDNTPHVETDSANFGDVTADKVMRGYTATSKNGVKFAGTMPDLQSGRVVFNGATFDGDLLLGVASKSYSAINDTVAYQIGSGYGYSGVYNGGLNISLRTDSRVLLRRNVGFCFSHSVDMTPFNRVVIDYRSVGNISGNPSIEFVCFVTPIWHLARGAVIYDNQPIDKFNQISSSSIGVALNGQVTIDTRSLTGQCFVGCYAFVNISNSRDRYIGQLQITKIEFFN